MTHTTSVAVVGIGVMGTAIATRLIERGCDVVVVDLDTRRTAPLADLGATVAPDAAEATAHCDHVILSLNTADIVEAAIFGGRGVAQSAAPEKLLIDMSSISPAATRRLAARLREETGMGWVDCPLSGGAPGARAGRLTIMAGGEPADIARCREVMDHLAANLTDMGSLGSGQTTKLINQLLVGNAFASLVEAARLTLASGIDPARVPAALAGGRADSAVLQEFFIKFATSDESPTGRIDNMFKDLDTAFGYARECAVDTPLLDTNVELHRRMMDAGFGPLDSAAMMRFPTGESRELPSGSGADGPAPRPGLADEVPDVMDEGT